MATVDNLDVVDHLGDFPGQRPQVNAVLPDPVPTNGCLPDADPLRPPQRVAVAAGRGRDDEQRPAGLTIAGMYHVTELNSHAEQLVWAIHFTAEDDERLAPAPDNAVQLEITV